MCVFKRYVCAYVCPDCMPLQEKHSNRLNRQAAETGLYLYDEVVEDAKQRPGAHKNIDLLLRVQEEGSDMEIVVDK